MESSRCVGRVPLARLQAVQEASRTDKHVALKSAVCEYTGLELTRTFTLAEEGSAGLTVTQTMRNVRPSCNTCRGLGDLKDQTMCRGLGDFHPILGCDDTWFDPLN